MQKGNAWESTYKAPPTKPWDINSFEKTNAIVRTEIIEEAIQGETKEKATENFYRYFHELEKKYGEGFVHAKIKSMSYSKDANGNIVTWVIKSEFCCHIPRKRIEDETR